MGIRHLQTFIQQTVPNGYLEVSLIDECEAFQRNHGSKPILVIDLLGLLTPFIKCRKEMLCGLRQKDIFNQLDSFFDKLHRIAELVFFEDGPVTNTKIPEWKKRQAENYDASIRIYDLIYQNYTLEQIISVEKNLPTVKSHMKTVETLAKKYGKLIVSVDRECDAEMAQFACRNERVLAILADDTDFLIYPGQWKYFSLRDMNQQTLVTKEYSRVALRNFLHLNDEELVLLSTLNGNDVIPFDDTFHFRRSLLQRHNDPSKRFPAIADHIRDFNLLQSKNLYVDVARRIYGPKFNKGHVKRIRASFEFYDISFRLAEIKDDLLRFCRDEGHFFVYSVLKYMPKTFTLQYHDLRFEAKYCDTNIKIFRRQMGVILKDSPERRYKVYTKLSHEGCYEDLYIAPMIPNIQNQPALMEILDRENYPQHDPIRFSLLKWMIDEEKLSDVNFEAIPPKYIFDILVLTLMVSEDLITTLEADLILLTNKHVETDTIPENITTPSLVNSRAFSIPFMYFKCCQIVGRCLQLTGLKRFSTMPNFDGVLFHNLFLKYVQQPFDILFLLADLKHYRYYA